MAVQRSHGITMASERRCMKKLLLLTLLGASTSNAAAAKTLADLSESDQKAARTETDRLILNNEFQAICDTLGQRSYKNLSVKKYALDKMKSKADKKLTHCLLQSLRQHMEPFNGGSELAIEQTKVQEAVVERLRGITKLPLKVNFWGSNPGLPTLKIPLDANGQLKKVLADVQAWQDSQSK